MKNFYNNINYIIFLLFIFITNCVTREINKEDEENKILLDISKKIKGNKINKKYQREEKIDIYLVPDYNKQPIENLTKYGKILKEVKMRLVSKWDDTNYYYAIILFENPEGPSVTGTVTLYAYDKLGRLIRTESFEKYFRAGNIFIKQYKFPKGGREVRWVIVLRGKK